MENFNKAESKTNEAYPFASFKTALNGYAFLMFALQNYKKNNYYVVIYEKI